MRKHFLLLLLPLLCCLAPLISPTQSHAATLSMFGQLHSPTGATGPRHVSPYTVTVPGTVVQELGTNTTDYALTSDGQVYAWGAAKDGELGNGQPASAEPGFTSTPSLVQFPAGVTIASLTSTAGDGDGLALSTDGTLYGWGYNHSGELCTTNQANVLAPIVVAPNVTLAAGAGDHTIYVSGGQLYGCGTDLDHDLGSAGNTRLHKPKDGSAAQPITGVPGTITALRASYHNSAAVADGSLYMWGLDNLGQVGDGGTTDVSTPTLVNLPAPVAQASVGGSLINNGQSVAMLTDGSIWSWGSNGFGQLGNGTVSTSSTPTPVTVPDGVTFTSVISGGSAEYALSSTGQVYDDGQNNDGQLGLGKADNGAHPTLSPIGLTATSLSSTAFNVVAQ